MLQLFYLHIHLQRDTTHFCQYIDPPRFYTDNTSESFLKNKNRMNEKQSISQFVFLHICKDDYYIEPQIIRLYKYHNKNIYNIGQISVIFNILLFFWTHILIYVL